MPNALLRTATALAISLVCSPWFAVAAERPPVERVAVDFEKQVVPVLLRNCSACHNPGEMAGGLDLLHLEAAFKAGESEMPAIVPGKVDESYLIDRIEAGEMPPEGKGTPVTADELATLKAWIAEGATWPEGRTLSPFEVTTDLRAGRDWWSLKPPVRPEVPGAGVSPSGVRTPIDAFIAQKLIAKNLAMSPEADRATLIRRVKLDLLGLPPTPEEVQAFVADTSEDSYERLVDACIASPHYGERWARHWLDVVRFAESQGFEMNQIRGNAWPYRDYVIQSLNEDKPYNQFVMEQIAGDHFGVDVATGLLVAGPWDQVKSPDIELTKMQRLAELDDMTSTTSTAFLGLTTGCAKCHDHKFDPISQHDYFALQANFAGVQHGERALRKSRGEEELNALHRKLAGIKAHQQGLLKRNQPLASVSDPPPTDARPRLHATGNVDCFPATSARFVRFTVLETNQAEPCLDELEIFSAEPKPMNVALAANGAVATASGVYGDGSLAIHQLKHVNDGVYGNARSWISSEIGRGWVQIELKQPTVIDTVLWARDREGVYSDRLPIRYTIEVATEPDTWTLVATERDRQRYDPAAPAEKLTPEKLPAELASEYAALATKAAELQKRIDVIKPQMAYVGIFNNPSEPTRRLHRGEPLQPKEEIAPGSIATLPEHFELAMSEPEAARRLALAQWIASDKNPLTARVMVNRIWHYHFGQGLIRNPSDFGFNGGMPSHPELLDWLATELMANGWHLKPIHRLILLSSAYRQSSSARGADGTALKGQEVDGNNTLLWRFSPRRLEAEPIRDTVLAVTGALDLRMGGPGFDVFEPDGNYVKVYNPKQVFGPDEFRRMIYQQKPRMQQDATFGAFDCPDSGQAIGKRNASTTALQALNLLNGPFMVDQSKRFAARLEREAAADRAKQIDRGFWLAFSRSPSDDERANATALIEAEGLPAMCRAILNANELIFIQ